MDDLLSKLALQIDNASNRNDVAALTLALEEIDRINRSELSPIAQASLDFYAANANAGIRQAKKEHNDWAWFQPTLESEMYHLRSALKPIASLSLSEIRTDLKPRITTNLANAFNHVGRFVEAIELWDQAASELPQFSMAIGNKALAIFWYAKYIENKTTQILFLKKSRELFFQAVSVGVEDHAKQHMEGWLKHLDSLANWLEISPPSPAYRAGRSKAEKNYRKWCVRQRLVLNFANDLSQDYVSLNDELTLPPITLSTQEKELLPTPYAIFNQLKQEYVSVRYMIFEAINEQHSPLHFADKGVILYDALDYRCYRLWIERLKMAFLSAHAILDKVAYLVNEYWKLAMPVRSINFNSIWFSEMRPNLKIRSQFATSNNWPLRGLFSLSRDFYYQSKSDRAVDPDAKVLHDIRNHIAHKYLRVHDDLLYNAAGDRDRNGQDLSFPVSEAELIEQTIKLLKLVRSALIYTSAAIAHEEAQKTSGLSSEFIGTMPIWSVDDRYRL
ncbi:MAG: hypothetical protein KGZ83_10595 [Sulfuricella sp.]|nr:hypothetical protein [Sulfuricella sp.]